MPPVPDSAPILWHDSFNQPYSWGGTNPPVVSVENWGDFAESWSGYGLSRSGILVPPYTLPGTDTNGKALIRPANGALRVWLSPLWSSATLTNGTGPGTAATLFELAATDHQSTPLPCWRLQFDPDGSMLVLTAQSDVGEIELLAAQLQWSAGQAHLVALTFGTNGTELYLDGELAAQGPGTIALPPAGAIMSIGSSFLGTGAIECVMDELSSLARPLTASEVAFHYRANLQHVSMGPVSAEEELARAEARAAGIWQFRPSLHSPACRHAFARELQSPVLFRGQDCQRLFKHTGLSRAKDCRFLHC